LYLVVSLKRAVELVASLLISSAQLAAALYFVTGSSSQYFFYSGPENISARFVVAPALAVQQVRERVISFNPLGVFVAQVRECILNSFRAQVALLRSHYLARRAEALFVGLLRCLDRHLDLGAVSDAWEKFKTYLNASKAVASITETHIARKVKAQSRYIHFPHLCLTMIAFSPRTA
jgi:DNA-directed RNA polymerase specialized sigma54-like protein